MIIIVITSFGGDISGLYVFVYLLKVNFIEVGGYIIEPQHDTINEMACAPSEDSDQPGHPPSLIRVIAVRSMGS